MVSCFLCGRPIKGSKIIDEVIEEKHQAFDSDDCLLIFKKLDTVYGKEYFIIEC